MSVPSSVFDINAPVNMPVRHLHEGCSKRGDKTLIVTRTNTGWMYYCQRCKKYGFKDLSGLGGAAVAQFAKNRLNKIFRTTEQLTLPDRSNHNTPAWVEVWLAKYGLEPEETNGYLSIDNRWVIPVYSKDGELVYWASRGDNPKWITQKKLGKGDIVYSPNFNKRGDNVYLVEDMISAIKVGRVAPVRALLGSYISDRLIFDLTKEFRLITIWLDFDKRSYSIMKSKRYREFGLQVSSKITLKDPKECICSI